MIIQRNLMHSLTLISHQFNQRLYSSFQSLSYYNCPCYQMLVKWGTCLYRRPSSCPRTLPNLPYYLAPPRRHRQCTVSLSA
ncbi:hypothetical protein FGO68_gene1935 [Halteria grandinella]|uniref:Uncharacterized protein n=1 Tax=Halteria grandinella TaxID=5974 RepID=A0A8J8NDZ5_HALGN|nr:hypothetical protein FGO68_gene1935 [Halteria grandinella]